MRNLLDFMLRYAGIVDEILSSTQGVGDERRAALENPADAAQHSAKENSRLARRREFICSKTEAAIETVEKLPRRFG